jgi:hypothetical protein
LLPTWSSHNPHPASPEIACHHQVSKDKLTIRYTGPGDHETDVGSIQGNRIVPKQQRVFYYEATVVDAGLKGLIALGFAEKGFNLGKHPGWATTSPLVRCGITTALTTLKLAGPDWIITPTDRRHRRWKRPTHHPALCESAKVLPAARRAEMNSYGYDGETGKKMAGSTGPSRSSSQAYGPIYSTGDVVGAGILLETQEMFFT